MTNVTFSYNMHLIDSRFNVIKKNKYKYKWSYQNAIAESDKMALKFEVDLVI